MAFALLCAVRSAFAEPPGAAAAAPRPSVDTICRTLAQAAAANDLPPEFFVRLIWQESHFASPNLALFERVRPPARRRRRLHRARQPAQLVDGADP